MLTKFAKRYLILVAIGDSCRFLRSELQIIGCQESGKGNFIASLLSWAKNEIENIEMGAENVYFPLQLGKDSHLDSWILPGLECIRRSNFLFFDYFRLC